MEIKIGTKIGLYEAHPQGFITLVNKGAVIEIRALYANGDDHIDISFVGYNGRTYTYDSRYDTNLRLGYQTMGV